MGTERIHVILDGADSRDCAERIGALHDLEHGRLVVWTTARVTSRSLLRDVLRALDKRLELPETPPRHRARELAVLWIAAEKVRDVYVLRAHLLDAAAVRLILSVVTSTTDVWFVSATHELPPGIRDAIVEFVVDRGHGDPRSTENLALDVPRGCPCLRLLESSQLSGMRLTDNATFSLEPEIGPLPTIGPVKRRRFNRAARPPGRFDGGRFGSSP